MLIISERGEKVNTLSSDISVYAPLLAVTAEQWSAHKHSIGQISDRLDKIGEHGRAFRMRNCADVVKFAFCPECGTKHLIHANLCRDRFCPVCSWRLSLKRFASMCQIVSYLSTLHPASSWQFVTLTLENCRPDQLSDTIREMSETWNRIWSRKSTKQRPILGWARSLEVTYNSKTHTLHPHYHVLIMYERGYTSSWLVDAWLKTVLRRTDAAAQNFQNIKPRVNGADELEAAMSAVLETYKYSVKSNDLLTMPLAEFKLFDRQLKGKRMQSFGGEIKEAARILDAEGDEIDTGDTVVACPRCGNVDLISIIGTWCGDGYIWRRNRE